MELILQRWSWLATFLSAILSAFFIARTVNTLAASAIAPSPGLSSGAGDRPHNSATAYAELDGDRFAKAFDLPVPKPIDLTAGPGGIASAQTQAAAVKPGWTDDAVRSPLHGILVGTALASPDRWSLCQITNTDANETLVYALGDTFLDARIYKIEKAKVYIDNDGKNEFIDVNPPGGPNVGVVPVVAAAGVKQTSENQYTISKKEIDDALANLSDLATKARIVPSFKNGAPNGFKLFSIVPDSLYSKIGVQNGDVIHKINGYEMNSPDKALEIYQKLRDSTRIDIELERRGDTIRKQYSIE